MIFDKLGCFLSVSLQVVFDKSVWCFSQLIELQIKIIGKIFGGMEINA